MTIQNQIDNNLSVLSKRNLDENTIERNHKAWLINRVRMLTQNSDWLSNLPNVQLEKALISLSDE